MTAIVIYGDAVQQARNRIRSVQVSVMFNILGYMQISEGEQYASLLVTKINSLKEVPGNGAANANLARAKIYINNFYNNNNGEGGEVKDVFALGDAIREVGEYIENGGAGKSIKDFENNLRNKVAFDKSTNRARQEVSDYALSEWPPLGIFKNRLLDRSVVKYMERFYGPYIGADISGTTTDGLAVLAYLENVGNENGMKERAMTQAQQGWELPPIASMVLQYHHSLLECGLALALKNSALKEGESDESLLRYFNYYDLGTLLNSIRAKSIFSHLLRDGSEMMRSELGGYRLIVLRDFIDVGSVDREYCEIGLLVNGCDDMFNIGQEVYNLFCEKIRDQLISGDGAYRDGNPSLLNVALSCGGNVGISEDGIKNLARMKLADLKNLKENGKAFDDLYNVIRGASPNQGVGIVDSGDAAAEDSAVETTPPNTLLSTLNSLQPSQLAALRKILSN
ncbi:hypothetical protein [Xanthomonas sp. GPE 39]|uniref:hypothetical protein n=1 Tax=Xanthomonas sp. GPE 39 TaxID=1583099 RepID=UPI0005F2D734|nr:hypothetical protein [Xanthomonas sp. GPE 39]